MKILVLQAFPTCWQDMMDVHPASDDRKRMFSHLLTHEGYIRWHRRIKKEGV